jgi:hypothetical protein
MEFDQNRTFRVAVAEDGHAPGFGQHALKHWAIFTISLREKNFALLDLANSRGITRPRAQRRPEWLRVQAKSTPPEYATVAVPEDGHAPFYPKFF